MRTFIILATSALLAATAIASPATALERGSPNTQTRSDYCADKLKTCKDGVRDGCKNVPTGNLYRDVCEASGNDTCTRNFGSHSSCNTEAKSVTVPQASRPKTFATH